MEQDKELREVNNSVVGSVQGEIRKKSKMAKFFGGLVSSDATNVGQYIIGDVLAPAIRKCVSDAIKGSVDMMFGTSGRDSRYSYDRDPWGSRDYRSYDKVYEKDPRRVSTGTYSYDDVLFTSRYDAEQFRADLIAHMNRYRTLSVAQMYDIANVRPGAYTDNNYGWKDVRDIDGAGVGETRDGKYYLRLTRPTTL